MLARLGGGCDLMKGRKLGKGCEDRVIRASTGPTTVVVGSHTSCTIVLVANLKAAAECRSLNASATTFKHLKSPDSKHRFGPFRVQSTLLLDRGHQSLKRKRIEINIPSSIPKY